MFVNKEGKIKTNDFLKKKNHKEILLQEIPKIHTHKHKTLKWVILLLDDKAITVEKSLTVQCQEWVTIL